MVLSILGSVFTILAVLLPEILKWLERNQTVRSAANAALTRLSLDNLRKLRTRVRQSQGETPVRPE
jgi:hypothetical protein